MLRMIILFFGLQAFAATAIADTGSPMNCLDQASRFGKTFYEGMIPKNKDFRVIVNLKKREIDSQSSYSERGVYEQYEIIPVYEDKYREMDLSGNLADLLNNPSNYIADVIYVGSLGKLKVAMMQYVQMSGPDKNKSTIYTKNKTANIETLDNFCHLMNVKYKPGAAEVNAPAFATE